MSDIDRTLKLQFAARDMYEAAIALAATPEDHSAYRFRLERLEDAEKRMAGLLGISVSKLKTRKAA